MAEDLEERLTMCEMPSPEALDAYRTAVLEMREVISRAVGITYDMIVASDPSITKPSEIRIRVSQWP